MATRKIMDCVDTTTGEKIYPVGHAMATYASDGKTLQEKFDDGDFLDKTKADELYQAAGLSFTNVEASAWVASTTYEDYAYQCDVACAGVTADDYAEVVFNLTESVSGDYAPLCETLTDAVRIYSKSDATITIPTIIVTK